MVVLLMKYIKKILQILQIISGNSYVRKKYTRRILVLLLKTEEILMSW